MSSHGITVRVQIGLSSWDQIVEPDASLCLVPAGLCQAAVHALKKENKAVRGKVVSILAVFFARLDDRFHHAAMAVLVTGGAVELAMGHMVETGLELLLYGEELFNDFFDDPRGQDRVCTGAVADPLIKWAAKWLPQVRNMVV